MTDDKKEAAPDTLRIARHHKWEDHIPTASLLENVGDVISLVAAMRPIERVGLMNLAKDSLNRYGKANAMVEFSFCGRVFTAPAHMCELVLTDIQALQQTEALARTVAGMPEKPTVAEDIAMTLEAVAQDNKEEP